MNECNKKLKELLEDVVMPDIEDAIDDIFEEIATNKNASKEEEETLEEFQEMRKEFTLILDDINNDKLELDECKELLEEISIMIEEAEEE
jgi:phosphoglycolate phosphatase-like HAD superfamily hydrolase